MWFSGVCACACARVCVSVLRGAPSLWGDWLHRRTLGGGWRGRREGKEKGRGGSQCQWPQSTPRLPPQSAPRQTACCPLLCAPPRSGPPPRPCSRPAWSWTRSRLGCEWPGWQRPRSRETVVKLKSVSSVLVQSSTRRSPGLARCLLGPALAFGPTSRATLDLGARCSGSRPW